MGQLTDHQGFTVLAPLFYVSPNQINYLVPPSVTPGRWTVSVKNFGNPVGSGILQVDTVAPSLFTANQSGQGPSAECGVAPNDSASQKSGIVWPNPRPVVSSGNWKEAWA